MRPINAYTLKQQKRNDKGHLIRRLKPKRRQLNTRHVHIPELEELDLPVLLPDDRVPDRNSGWLGDLYTPDGACINISVMRDSSAYAQAFGALWDLKSENRLRSETFYRQGVAIYVSTVYLVLAHGLDDDLPQIWETMVFVASDQFELYSMRYAGKHAAYEGHRIITQIIRDSQRARRADWEERPRRIAAQLGVRVLPPNYKWWVQVGHLYNVPLKLIKPLKLVKTF